MGLRSLHITPSLVPHSRNARRQHQLLSVLSTSPESSGGSDIDSLSDVDSSSSILGYDEDRDFPVEILPELFLGNAVNSEDLEWLKKHNIEVSFNFQFYTPNTPKSILIITEPVTRYTYVLFASVLFCTIHFFYK